MRPLEKSVALTWLAEYADGTVIRESPANNYGNLKREGLVAFGLEKDGKPHAVIHLGPGKVLFYRMRVILDVSGQSSERIYMVGYRQKDKATKLIVIDAEGQTHTYTSFKAANLADLEYYEQERV